MSNTERLNGQLFCLNIKQENKMNINNLEKAIKIYRNLFPVIFSHFCVLENEPKNLYKSQDIKEVSSYVCDLFIHHISILCFDDESWDTSNYRKKEETLEQLVGHIIKIERGNK